MKKVLKRLIVILILLFVVTNLCEYIFRDRTANGNMPGGFIWKDIQYVPIVAQCGSVGKIIAETDDGHKISEYEDDSSHTFLELRSFLDNNTVVREDYVIPTEGTISCVYVSGERITDSDFIEAISEITVCEFSDSFNIETDNILYYAEHIYVGYEDCPVGTDHIGYIANLNSKWVFIPTNSDKSSEVYICNVIPQQYVEILAESGLFSSKTVDEL